MSETARLVTSEELAKFPDGDRRYELVDGRVIRMSPVGFQHGRVVVRLCALLDQHVEGRNLGGRRHRVGIRAGEGSRYRERA